jgi:hypothetical protein
VSPLTLYEEVSDGLLTDTCPQVPVDPKGMHVLAYRHFFECIRAGVDTQSPPERSIAVMRILDAIYASAAGGGLQVWFN